MKLLTLKQTDIRQTDTVFAGTSLSKGIVSLVMWCLTAAAFYIVIFGRLGSFDPPRLLAFFIGLFFLLFAWLAGGSWKSSRRPTNWLVRLRPSEMLIKFRSYQNWRMSEDDVQVIELHRDEIESVRKTVQRQISRTSDSDSGGVQANRRVSLEIILKNKDTRDLEKALAEERSRPGWGSDRSRTKALDYPVTADSGVITIGWRDNTNALRPNLNAALRELSRFAKVTEESYVTTDLTPSALKDLSEPEQRKKLRALATADRFSAIRTARELYGGSLSDATKRVDAALAESD
jgi:hypothetical protein